MNSRPSGYEPDELPDCSTPRRANHSLPVAYQVVKRPRSKTSEMAGHTHFDESTEEYLEAIYRLDREGPGVTTSGLAADLGVAPASVSGMLKKLAAEGYLAYVARGEAKLTERGLSVAVRVMRRHRLAECFLTNILGMPWTK